MTEHPTQWRRVLFPITSFDITTRAGQQVGEIAICFCCDGVSAKPDMVGPVPTGVGDIQIEFGAKLQSVIEAMGLPTNVRCD